jgi:hypothetical protein
VWVAVPGGFGRLRDGPVLVASRTEQPAPLPPQAAAVVRTYQLRPWSICSGASSHCTVPKGSKAAGQPLAAAATLAPIRSGWDQSVPPSNTAAVVPSPAKPARHAWVKLWVLASSTFSLLNCSKVEPRGGGAWENGTSAARVAATALALAAPLSGARRFSLKSTGVPSIRKVIERTDTTLESLASFTSCWAGLRPTTSETSPDRVVWDRSSRRATPRGSPTTLTNTGTLPLAWRSTIWSRSLPSLRRPWSDEVLTARGASLRAPVC